MNGITNASWHKSIIRASTLTRRPATSNEAHSACFLHRLSDSLDTLSEISSNKQNHSYPGKMVVFKFSSKYFFTFTHWNVFLLFSICLSIFLWMTVWNACNPEHMFLASLLCCVNPKIPPPSPLPPFVCPILRLWALNFVFIIPLIFLVLSYRMQLYQ